MLFFISTVASFNKVSQNSEVSLSGGEMERGICPQYLQGGTYAIYSPAFDFSNSNVTSIFVLFLYH